MNRLILIVTSLISVISVNYAQTLSKYIVIDQFGYRPNDQKIAVIRDPQIGFDAAESFSPGGEYCVVNADTRTVLYTSGITSWNNGLVDASSGDKAWWFDFSTVTTSGDYYIWDYQKNLRSHTFRISDNVYDDVLKHSVRSFYYQRVGFEKKLPYAEAGWEDGASHIGPLQDKNCRPYDDKTNAAKERDVSGGWYDAGDYNKYTIWTANYVYEMLASYEENPNAWTDDYNLPESGNGIPDLLDEAKWGMDHLLKLQNTDGSVIALVDLSHASPPSAATGQSLYGGVSTAASSATASAYAYGAKVFRKLDMTSYADQLQEAAIKAYAWAEANPNVQWRNNDASNGTSGLGAGQQEVDDYGRFSYRMRAAAHLFELTADSKYKTYFENNYLKVNMMAWTYVYPYEMRQQETLLYYSALPGVSAGVRSAIRSRYSSSILNNDHNLKAYDNSLDPYHAKLSSYTWGSNATKSNHGNLLYDAVLYGTNSTRNEDLKKAAEGYIHYLHGLNPLNKCYLSNMNAKGAENSVTQFYHTWFTDKSTKWDEVGVSTFGPAPGFLVGGPNPSYDWDGCCPGSCGGSANNAICSSMSITPPKNQPEQKSYLDFNTSWPLNSWEVTENSCGYQIAYIRLLSKFVDRSAIINGIEKQWEKASMALYPNPSKGLFTMDLPEDFVAKTIQVSDLQGRVVFTTNFESEILNLETLDKGTYLVEVAGDSAKLVEKIMIK